MPGKAQHLRTYPAKWVLVVKIVVEVVVKIVLVFEIMVISFVPRW